MRERQCWTPVCRTAQTDTVDTQNIGTPTLSGSLQRTTRHMQPIAPCSSYIAAQTGHQATQKQWQRYCNIHHPRQNAAVHAALLTEGNCRKLRVRALLDN